MFRRQRDGRTRNSRPSVAKECSLYGDSLRSARCRASWDASTTPDDRNAKATQRNNGARAESAQGASSALLHVRFFFKPEKGD
jgi:hypothetical protein